MMKSTAPPATNAAGPSTAVAGTWFELQPIELQPMELQPMELQPLPPEVPSGPTAATFMEAPEQIVVIHHPAPFTTTNPPGKSSAAGPSSLVSQQPAQPTTTANPPTPFTPVSNPSKIPTSNPTNYYTCGFKLDNLGITSASASTNQSMAFWQLKPDMWPEPAPARDAIIRIATCIEVSNACCSSRSSTEAATAPAR
ncbi:hypothetical protein AJ79_07123 [Helicocarpus griseus UAMH5409]|uniref:Uncharacterized protein n=1 Tax=Helicocarpus griseus UAMH5409 TaxID=1447875 RepID=A0A2B7X6E8_9EURO|nr:hypothetical protein AJ79_07123 [Helicocarpus griseus UAMH5409]